MAHGRPSVDPIPSGTSRSRRSARRSTGCRLQSSSRRRMFDRSRHGDPGSALRALEPADVTRLATSTSGSARWRQRSRGRTTSSVQTSGAALRKLAVFVGGCLLDAAEQVAGADLDLLESLLDKSLLRHRVDEAGQDRYWMLETIREYAGSALVVAGERTDTERRHREHFASIAGKLMSHVVHGVTTEQLARYRADRANFRVALSGAIEAGDVDECASVHPVPRQNLVRPARSRHSMRSQPRCSSSTGETTRTARTRSLRPPSSRPSSGRSTRRERCSTRPSGSSIEYRISAGSPWSVADGRTSRWRSATLSMRSSWPSRHSSSHLALAICTSPPAKRTRSPVP